MVRGEQAQPYKEVTMNYLDTLVSLEQQIKKDLEVTTDPEDADEHLEALGAVEALIDYLK